MAADNGVKRSIAIKPGLELKVRALRWDDGWEFDCPVVIIDPVLRTHEDGCSFEYAIESMCIDACIDETLTDHEAWRWDGAPGGSMAYLRRKYHRKNVEKYDCMVRFFLDEDLELTWEELPITSKK